MIRRLIHIILLGVFVAACSDDKEAFQWEERTDELTLTLRLPGFATVSRAVDENVISDLRVLFFDGSGSYISEAPVEPTDMTGTHPDYKVKLRVPPVASKVELVANYGKAVGGASSSAVIDALPTGNIIMSGATSVEELKQPSPVVYLLRSVAKTTVENKATDFEIEELFHYGASTKGFVAPVTEGRVNIPDEAGAAGEERFSEGEPFYLFETEAKKCFIIIHGRYRGTEGWYKVAYIPAGGDAEGKEGPVLRNHHYQFTVAEVSDCGWASKEEAIASKPDNRMTVELRDHDEAIYSMIACRDYELGVSKNVLVPAEATEAVVDILTSYPAATYTIEYSTSEAAWVKSYAQTSVEIVSSETQSEARHYKVSFAIEPNSLSEEERTATITVRSGDLSRTVCIVQQGSDLKRGRKAYIHNLDGNPAGQDYFKFIDEVLQGATENAMGVARNNSLHFRVYNNNYYYTIPCLEGDEVNITSGNGCFNVSREGNVWKVTARGNDNYQLWDGGFTIANRANNATLSYEICHRGLFHKLGGEHQLGGPSRTLLSSGWFYYEQVNVKGEDGQSYCVLDRNLGASSNRPYSVSSTLYSANAGARGGYFRIAGTKGDNTIIEGISPEGFEVPAAYHLNQLPIQLSNNSDAIPNIRVTEGAMAYITLPIAGYMEGEVHKDEAHACLWSRTLLSGNQGFSETSEEYGWWFRYLDIYGERKTITNTRICTPGGEPRGMTVRCLHGPAVPDGWDIPDPGTNRKRVIVRNAPADGLWCYFAGCPKDKTDGWPKMYKFGSNSVYYDVPQSVNSLEVSHGGKNFVLDLSRTTDWTRVNDYDYRQTE